MKGLYFLNICALDKNLEEGQGKQLCDSKKSKKSVSARSPLRTRVEGELAEAARSLVTKFDCADLPETYES